MVIRRKFTKNSGLYPHLKYILKNIPEELYYGKSHVNRVRPPSTIYAISTNEFIDALILLTESTLKIREKKANKDNTMLIKDMLQVQLLNCIYHLCSYYDECFLILKSITPEIDSSNREGSKWLSLNNSILGKVFKGNCGKAISQWQDLNNRLKHNNQKFNYIGLVGNRGLSNGFYIENVKEDGKPYIDTDFHDRKRNSFCITFERAIGNMFSTYLFLSDRLESIIKTHLATCGIIIPSILNSDFEIKEEKTMHELWKLLNNFEYSFFPTEEGFKYTHVKEIENGYLIEYPKRVKHTNQGSLVTSVARYADGIPLVNITHK